MPANPPAKVPANGAPKPKGKPGGIPIWGWVAAGVLGLVIAYVITRKSGLGSSSSDSGTAGTSGSSPLGSSDAGNSAGGVVAPPSADINQQIIDELRALGLIGGGTTGGGASSPTSGASSGATDTSSPPTSSISPSFDSAFANAQFQTTSYVAPSGQMVLGPGGPVVDTDTTAPISSSSSGSTPSATNPNILAPGAVVS